MLLFQARGNVAVHHLLIRKTLIVETQLINECITKRPQTQGTGFQRHRNQPEPPRAYR